MQVPTAMSCFPKKWKIFGQAIQNGRLVLGDLNGLAKAVQGLCARVPVFMDTHRGGREGVFSLQQHADIAPGQSLVSGV